MMDFSEYKNAFIGAIGLHLALLIILTIDPSSHQAASLSMEASRPLQAPTLPEVEPIKAVSVNTDDVLKKVNELKAQREQKAREEARQQEALKRQAEALKNARIMEQKRIAKLKEEADKIAIARKAQEEAEKKRLKELALQKEAEKKRLETLKKEQESLLKRQQEEAKRFADLQKQKEAELAKLNAEKAKKEKEEKDKQQKAQQAAREAQEQKARQQAEAQRLMQAQKARDDARLAGEVDRYKALIVNAISRQWILPEKVNPGLSSEFRIRLAPNGSVLDVTLTRTSGDAILDRSAQSAIYKASPLPVPADAATFDMFREITLTVRPESVRG